MTAAARQEAACRRRSPAPLSFSQASRHIWSVRWRRCRSLEEEVQTAIICATKIFSSAIQCACSTGMEGTRRRLRALVARLLSAAHHESAPFRLPLPKRVEESVGRKKSG